MSGETCTITLKLRWWVRPLVLLMAIVLPLFGIEEDGLSRFIARNGFKVTVK